MQNYASKSRRIVVFAPAKILAFCRLMRPRQWIAVAIVVLGLLGRGYYYIFSFDFSQYVGSSARAKEANDSSLLSSKQLQTTTPTNNISEERIPFPRWDWKTGIDTAVLLACIEDSKFGKDLYIVNASGIYASKTLRAHNSPGFLAGRVTKTEPAMAQAVKMLLNDTLLFDDDDDVDRWARLREVVNTHGGLAFIMKYEDWRKCNNGLWQKKPIPLFTVAAPAFDCNHSFPVPTYQNVIDSQSEESEWDRVMSDWQQQYAPKIPKVVWRGRLTGVGSSANPYWRENVRWRLVAAARLANATETRYFDVAFYNIAASFENVADMQAAVDSPIKPMAAFQKYAAILDADGNSWSSRFETLFCYSSVVMKVEPVYVDYLHFRKDNPLIPWVHFVPVRNDLSDLYQNAAWVLDPANTPAVQEMIRAANTWCRKQMTMSALGMDFLDIWEVYVKLLDIGDPEWYKVMQERVFANPSYDFMSLM